MSISNSMVSSMSCSSTLLICFGVGKPSGTVSLSDWVFQQINKRDLLNNVGLGLGSH